MGNKRNGWKESPEMSRSIPELFRTRVAESGSEEFGVFREEEFTFESLWDAVTQLASGLDRLGIRVGDRVAVFMNNRPAFVKMFFAVTRLGAIFVPFNAHLRGEDLAYIFNDVDPAVILIGPDCVDRYITARDSIGPSEEILLEDDERLEDSSQFQDIFCSSRPPERDLNRSSLASILYTSGTTGRPKGVKLPHGSYISSAVANAKEIIRPQANDVLHMTQPLYHTFAQMVIMESLVTGVPFAIERKFSTSCFWDQVEKHGATIIHLAPSLAEMLLNETTAEENPVRITYGVGGVLSQQFSEQFDCTVVPLYGLTETGGLATSGRSTDPCTGTIGRPTSTVEVTVVDENDEPVPPNTKGEILIRPNQPYAMFQGYYGKPKETQEALRNQWLHTGDIGYYDEEGRFHFAGRKSYFARRKGENVSMNEVERVIDHDERVERVVCVPVSAEVSGEEILAAIILEHNAQMDPEEILELCEEQLAYFKVPRYVRFVDKFPTTATKGNIKRVELADTSLAWDCDAAGYELKK